MIKKIAGIILISTGAVMLTLTWQEYSSISSGLTRILKRSLSDKTIWLLSGGTLCYMAGLLNILRAR